MMPGEPGCAFYTQLVKRRRALHIGAAAYVPLINWLRVQSRTDECVPSVPFAEGGQQMHRMRALQCSQIRIRARQFLCPGHPALKGLFQSYRLCRPYGSCIANGREVPYMQVGPGQSILLECTFGAVAMDVGHFHWSVYTTFYQCRL